MEIWDCIETEIALNRNAAILDNLKTTALHAPSTIKIWENLYNINV